MIDQEPVTPWDDNLIQFARLLCEIRACCTINQDDFDDLCDSMELAPKYIEQIYDRAEVEFQRAKNGGRPMRMTPHMDMQKLKLGHIGAIV